MAVRLKRVEDQVIVLTGASSGIGLATARMAAGRGAKLLLASRNEDALNLLAKEINDAGGEAAVAVADVGREEDVRKIADVAQKRFGGFDTWVNNAGTAIYGGLMDIATEDSRRLFDTNFWGVVYGSLEAARRLRNSGRSHGAAIINVGSEVSDRAVPVIGMYSASKHAVKGFTDALRMELEEAGDDVSVSLVKPAAIDTPFPQHAKTYMDEEPMLPKPVYVPQVVAEVILHCAEVPTRDMFASGAAKSDSLLGGLAPRLMDWMMEALFFDKQKSGRPANRADDSLHRPTTGMQERGNATGHVRRWSAYNKATMHPLLTGAAVVGAGLAIASLVGMAGSNGTTRREKR